MKGDHLHEPETYARSRETLRRRLDAEFWAKTDRAGECWVWTGARQTKGRYGTGGYGILIRFGRQLYAHRRAWELANGPIPSGMVVMHVCDNPPCIRPDHLRLGTQAENMADMVAKGRASNRTGELNKRARLTEDDVRAIRGAHRLGQAAALARQYGVARQTVQALIDGTTWRHVK